MENCSKIYIFDSNANSREILKSFFIEIRNDLQITLYDDFEKMLSDLKNDDTKSIVFVDISEGGEQKLSSLDNFDKDSHKIVITSTDYSIDNIVRSMRVGAKEFLPKPILKEDLERVLKNVAISNDFIEGGSSKIITVYSNKGGIGKTTIAANLAAEMAKATRDKVALIDLNFQLGDISTFFNLNSTFDVAYAVKNLVNKNGDAFLRAFERYNNSNLYILSDPIYIEQAESITPQEIEALFKILKSIFPYIIVDMSANIDSVSLKILDKSDLILFTSIVNIPAIRNAQRCINLFKSRNYPTDKVKILINRYMENDDIKIADIEEALGERVYWKIPNNYFTIMSAINKGIPVGLINEESNIARSYRDLAALLSDNIISPNPVKKQKRSNFNILDLFKK